MKTLLLTLALFTLAISTFAKELIIDRPHFICNNTSTIEIETVTLTDTATILYCKAYYRPRFWIRIVSETYLNVDGKKYMIRSADGIKLDAEHWMPDSGESEFTLYFEPIPTNTKSFDFIEGDCADCFKIWGIELSNDDLPPLRLDSQFKNYQLDYNTPLAEPILESGKVRLKGRVLDWKPSMSDYKVEVQLNFELISIPFNTKADGTFDVEFEVPHTTMVTISNAQFFVSPGEDITLNLNQRELSRMRSRIHSNSPSYGYAFYTNARYAALIDEVLHNTSIPYFNALRKSTRDVLGMDIYQYRDHIVDEFRLTSDQLQNDTTISDNLKITIKYRIINDLIQMLLMHSHFLEEAYRIANNIDLNDYENPLVGFKKLDAPTPDYFKIIKEFDIDNRYALSFAQLPYITYCLNMIAMSLSEPNPESPGSKPAEIKITDLYNVNEGIVSDLNEYSRAMHLFSQFTPLPDTQITELQAKINHPLFFESIKNNNLKLKAKIEENKAKSGYNIIDMTGVAPEQLLTTIIEKYKGKVIFIDFWATWCGPCRDAMKHAEPVKEQLKGKDVVFVYITNSSSPDNAWRNMIANIPGEHMMLNNEQSKYMSSVEYQYRGIPSYALIGKDGTKKHFQTGFMGAETMKSLIEAEL